MSNRPSATEALHTSGYRLTMQRQLVWDTLRQSKKHLSAEDILGQIRRQYPRFNLATVYRSLEVLDELGLVKETRIRDRAYYTTIWSATSAARHSTSRATTWCRCCITSLTSMNSWSATPTSSCTAAAPAARQRRRAPAKGTTAKIGTDG